jgi:hypothetical protein
MRNMEHNNIFMKSSVLSNFYFQSYLLNLVLIFSFLSHGGRSYDVIRYYLFFKILLNIPLL